MNAALLAARELGGPIIAMTIVLVAVYVPIGFQGGLTGALFTRVRLHARRRRHDLGRDCAHPLADDVLTGLHRRAGGRALHALPRPYLRAPARQLPAVARQSARHLAGIGAVRRAAAARAGAAVHDCEIRARPVRGPGRGARADHRTAGCHAAADAGLCRHGVRHLAQAPRIPADVPAHRRALGQPGLRRRAAHAVGGPHARRHADPAGTAAEVEQGAGCARRGLPVPGAAGPGGISDPVRHHHDRADREPQRGRQAGARQGQGERHVLFHRRGPEARPAAVDAHRRPRHGE